MQRSIDRIWGDLIFILQALGSLTNTRWRALLSAIADGLFVKDARKQMPLKAALVFLKRSLYPSPTLRTVVIIFVCLKSAAHTLFVGEFPEPSCQVRVYFPSWTR